MDSPRIVWYRDAGHHIPHLEDLCSLRPSRTVCGAITPHQHWSKHFNSAGRGGWISLYMYPTRAIISNLCENWVYIYLKVEEFGLYGCGIDKSIQGITKLLLFQLLLELPFDRCFSFDPCNEEATPKRCFLVFCFLEIEPLTADDLIPMLVFLIVRSSLPTW